MQSVGLSKNYSTDKQQTLDEWKKWNRQGLIPGPEETEAAFVERVLFCQDLEKRFIQQIECPFEMEDPKAKECLQEAFSLTESLYGIEPLWVPLVFSNHQLAPWHGGCAWIFQLTAKAPTAAFLQLRAHFRYSSSYLGLYHREELIAHELAHVGRMLYQDPQFEEIFAYQSSFSFLQRRLGPMIQSSKESLCFVLLLGLFLIVELSLFSFGGPLSIWFSWGLQWVLIACVLFSLGRLFYRHYVLKRCRSNFKGLYSDPLVVNHLLYRLRDHEIRQFAYWSQNQIDDFITQASHQSFRWRFLRTLYPLAQS
jgi:hypothetical protein